MLSIAISPIYIRLKEARMIFGVSQKKLGMMIGIDEFSASARMNQYETGKHIPDFLTLTRIAKILLVPVAYFYAVDNDLAGLLFLYEKYNSKAKERLLKFCKKLSKFKQNITAKILS